MIEEWLSASPTEIAMVLLSAGVTYAAILIFTRMVGLRSLSKMSAADFAMTVAVGSLFASTISSPSPSLLIGLCALASLYTGQWLVAAARLRSPTIQSVVDNRPLLLMVDGNFIDSHLRRANVTRNDIFAKMRECNAFSPDHVLAVVMESTGDVSVLHSRDSDAQIDSRVMAGVIGWPAS